MEFLAEFKNLISPEAIINAGYLVLFLIVFAESGLFFGFFFPGDSLLVLAGVAAGAGQLDIAFLMPLIFTAAFLGDQVGYWTGHTFGRRLFNREDSWLFRKEHVKKSEEFFAKYGNKTIILGRFVPIVRTFAPILAGVGNMPYKIFVLYNLIGAVVWGIGVTLLGYLLGNIPHIDRYLHYVIAVIILVSIIPVATHVMGSRKASST